VLVILVLLGLRSCGDDGKTARHAPERGDDRKTARHAPEPVELTLSFSGDLLMHAPIAARASELGGGDRYAFAPLFEEIKKYVSKPDLAFCHVEVPMTDAPLSGYPVFNAPPDLARDIAGTGWDACSTASNHSLDQGEEGVAATLASLDRAGVGHTGSAASPRDARRPLILEADGVRIALLAYTSDSNGIPVPAPHLLNLIDPERIAEDARRAREEGADAVIVNLHWASEIAPEYATEPNRAQWELVAALVKEPAITAIVGQGPHVAQPIREVGGDPVVFSEGNLISNQRADAGLAPESQDGYIALLDLVVDGEKARVTKMKYVPTWVNHLDYKVLPAGAGPEANEVDAAALSASYERTVGIVGREPARPVPFRLGQDTSP
jgi:poly-gamma-glutamate synthesis protein (capsule biosynthesis protein)